MKLKKEFADFYSAIRIDGEQQPLIDKRIKLVDDIKDNLPDILKPYGIYINKSDIKDIDQGSYKYNTNIKSDVFDRDVAVIVNFDKDDIDPLTAKECLKNSIDFYSRTVVIKEPCVRAVYHEYGVERYHIDLPLYARDEQGAMYLARGKRNTELKWEPADPYALNEDLCEKINGNYQLRRIICFIKKWKNEAYCGAKSDHEIPPSIGLTLLACDCFSQKIEDGVENDLLALYYTMKGIKDNFSVERDYSGNVVSAEIHRNLHVKPYTDIFAKMLSYGNGYMITFYERLCEAVDNLRNAINVSAEHDAALYVQKVLGDEFVVPAKRALESDASAKREHNFG